MKTIKIEMQITTFYIFSKTILMFFCSFEEINYICSMSKTRTYIFTTLSDSAREAFQARAYAMGLRPGHLLNKILIDNFKRLNKRTNAIAPPHYRKDLKYKPAKCSSINTVPTTTEPLEIFKEIVERHREENPDDRYKMTQLRMLRMWVMEELNTPATGIHGEAIPGNNFTYADLKPNRKKELAEV